MLIPKGITKPKQLIVEGADADYFFQALIKQMNLTGIQIQNFGGINDLGPFLKALSNVPDFYTQVSSMGIIRDAETDANAAFHSVCSALKAASLSVPKRPIISIGENPQISVFILPDNATPGMLETLCLRTVESDPVMECITQYFNCIQQKLGVLPKNQEKAKVQAFLASRDRPGLQLGQAARAGYWPWDSPALDRVKQFLQAL